MAFVIDDALLPPMRNRARPIVGRPTIYPWDTWLNGQTWRAHQDEDFDVSVVDFATMVRAYAKRRGGRAAASVVGTTVLFRFYPGAP